MTTAVRSINKKREPLNILMQACHEGYSDLLSYTGHNFYMLSGEGCKSWDAHTRPIPNNFYHIKSPNHLPNDIKIDVLFSQERYSNLQRFLQFRERTGIPVVHMDHALPPPGASKRQIEQLKQLRGDAHTYVTQMSKNAWGGAPEAPVIRYGIDPNLFSGWTGEVRRGVSVVNHIAQRDVFCGWGLFQEIAKALPIKLIGENPGLSESISDVKVLAKELAVSRFYLNTSNYSTFPLTIAEALMVGCPVISTNKQEIPLVIKHGENGFLAESPEDFIRYGKLLLEDDGLAASMSINARASAQNMFGMAQFVENWNSVFYGVLGL